MPFPLPVDECCPHEVFAGTETKPGRRGLRSGQSVGAGRGGKSQRLGLKGFRDGGASMVRRPGRSGCGFAALGLAGLRSEALQLLLEVCDFFTQGRDFVFQVGYAVTIGGWNGGIGDGIRG